MCGRFLSLSSPDELAERFEVDEVRDEVRTDPLPQRYNVAPSTSVYAVVARSQTRRLGTLRWGFVPHWATDLGRAQINARVESLGRSKMFSASFERRRCLVPADGFYEWHDRGNGSRKQPYHLADPDGSLIAFAGIWSVWRDPAQDDPDPVFSMAIVTTAAAGEMERLHRRMPVVLPPNLWDDWLTADVDAAPHLLDTVGALAAPRLTATPVTDRVNSVRNEGPELLRAGSVDAPSVEDPG